MSRPHIVFRIVLTLILFFSVRVSPAGQLVQEQFEGPLLPEQNTAEGLFGQGWVQPTNGEILVWPVSLEGAQVGMISFDLQRLPDAQPGEVDTVFDLLDDNEIRVLRMKVGWAVRNRGTALFLDSLPSRDYFQYGIRLWKPAVFLGREVKPGDWLHVDLFWDDVRAEYLVFADGVSLNARPEDTQQELEGDEAPDPRFRANAEAQMRGDPPPYPEKPLQYFLQRVTSVAVGNYPISNLPQGRNRKLLTNSVLDNFEIRVGTVVSTQSVTHDAFGKAGYSGHLVAGDTVTVTLVAEPGGTAVFDIHRPEMTVGGKITPPRKVVGGVALAEDLENPGTYSGGYKVEPGMYVENGQVVGRFTSRLGFDASPLAADQAISIDGRVHLSVNSSEDLVPADEGSVSEITVVATDANGKELRDRELKLTMSTTDEYTGLVGGGIFEDQVGASLDVDWKGITDSFGEVTAQYVSGFAAKTILVSAKDMQTGDVGVGWVRSYIDGTVDIVVKQPAARALAVTGSMDVSVSRDWLTADGRSRSRITAVVRDVEGKPMEGNQISFNLLGGNGSIRQIQSRTDSRGRAFADYIAGTVIGQVQIEVRDMTSGLVAVVGIELRSDAPAEISLTADPGEVFIGDARGSTVTAKVTDINDNPNTNTDVLFEVVAGDGTVSASEVATDHRDGVAEVTFLPGSNPGVNTVKATVMSREPTVEEIEAAEGAVFLYGLEEDPGRLEVVEWLVEPGDEVVEGQDLVVLEDRRGETYTVKAPRDGTLATFVAEERDRVEYGQTLGYVLPLEE